MPALAGGGQGVVEAHGDVANEQTPGIGDFHAGRREFHQPVGRKGRERGQFGGKVFGEVDAEFCG